MSKWLNTLQKARKQYTEDEKIGKVHYDFGNGKEMIEEYNMETTVLMRRAWKKEELNVGSKWDVEIGDPIPIINFENDPCISETSTQPYITRRITKRILEWRIHNLPYALEMYQLSVNTETKSIIVKTNNKKYYKVLPVPELERLDIEPHPDNLSFTYRRNTLIVAYKKPQELIDMDKEVFEEVKKLSEQQKEQMEDCKLS